MRLVVQTRLPEWRLRAALRQAAARAQKRAAAQREPGVPLDVGHLPATSMLGRLAARGPAADGLGRAAQRWAKIDEN